MPMFDPNSVLGKLLAPEVALPMAAALMGGQGNGQNLGNAFAMGGQGLAQQKQLQAQTAKSNQTIELLKRDAPDLAQGIEAGALTPADGYKLYVERRQGKQTDPYKVVGGQVFNTQDQSWISPPTAQGPAETGLNPQMMVNPTTGETIYVQPTKDGRLMKSDVPEGFQPYDPYSKSFATGRGGAEGKAAGEDAALYESVSSKMPGLETVIKKLDDLSDKATYTLGGQLLDTGIAQAGMEPREAAVARAEYIATVDNQVLPMLRDTFGAAFTVKEGETLRATLGDPNKTPKEKQAVLKAFIEQKRRDVMALGVRTGQGAPGGVDYKTKYGLD